MQLDLVDEMEWEDSDKEPALEEETHLHGKVFRNGIHAYLDWFYEGSIENDDY